MPQRALPRAQAAAEADLRADRPAAGADDGAGDGDRAPRPDELGKTHDALRFLVETGRGVYAAPLRMLAQEAHRRLSAELGEERVGLVTGEERVNPGASIVCCTAEMAPMHGETLVLDEVQWAEDEERGSAWTRLMLGGDYRHILLLGAVEALPLVRHAFPEADVRFFERKAPLDWVGRRGIAGLSAGTVVVAFSRRAVIGLAGELNQFHPGRVAASTARCRSRRGARRSTASSPARRRCAPPPTCSATA